MKKTLSILSVLFALVAAPAIAADAAHAEAPKTHKVSGEIVSVDVKANTLTYKDAAGKNQTVAVLGGAQAELKNLKAGEKVNMTCQDGAQGQHEGCSHIEAAPAAK